MIYKFFKFGIVGFSGLVIDFTITFLLKERLKLNKYIANSIGFSIAATSNYFLNRIWTFRSDNPEILTEYFNFIIVSLIGLILNNIFLFVFDKKLNNFYLSKLFAIGVTIIWNFFANTIFTFR